MAKIEIAIMNTQWKIEAAKKNHRRDAPEYQAKYRQQEPWMRSKFHPQLCHEDERSHQEAGRVERNVGDAELLGRRKLIEPSKER